MAGEDIHAPQPVSPPAIRVLPSGMLTDALFLSLQTTMSDFVALSANACLWDLATKATWGLHDFCPILTTFHMCEHASTVNCHFHGGVLGEYGEAQAGHGIFLIAPCITIRCGRVFGLTAVWAHPHQAHFPTLLEVAHKPVLLVNIKEDWLYAFM